MTFFNRLQSVFFEPQKVFKSLAEKPVWIDALIILLIVTALFSYLVAPYARKDTLQLYKDNVKLQERLGQERYEQMLHNLENPSQTGILLRSFLLSPITLLIGFLISALMLLVIGRLFSTEGNFILVFSAFLHANFIDKILGSAIRLVLILSRKSVFQTTTSLALLFPKLEMTSPAYIILSQVDIFQLWLFGVLAYGLSHLFKISIKKALFVSYAFWLLKSLLYIALGFLSHSFIG
ncbi:MAG: YIP1 family protein [Candidatus Aminicenantales bacterium]